MMIPTLGERETRISAKTRRRAKTNSAQEQFTEVIRDVLEEDAVQFSAEKEKEDNSRQHTHKETHRAPRLLLDGLDITV